MTAIMKTTAIAGLILAAAGPAFAASSGDANPAAIACGDFVAMDQESQTEALRAMRIELAQEGESDKSPEAAPMTTEKPADDAASSALSSDNLAGDGAEVTREHVAALQKACMGHSDKMAIDALSEM